MLPVVVIMSSFYFSFSPLARRGWDDVVILSKDEAVLNKKYKILKCREQLYLNIYFFLIKKKKMGCHEVFFIYFF